jgi:UDP-N-acetylmuramate dehydrogenase
MFQKDISLAEYTSFKIGGLAKYFFIAKTKEELIEAIKEAKRLNLKFFILGGGNNVLALDEGYDGLVIKLAFKSYHFNNHIYAESGVSLSELVALTIENSLKGLEWAAGVPGTVGGAVYGNAEAYNGKISDNIEKVEVLDILDLSIKTLTKEECLFSLKNSIFKKNKNLIILSVVFVLEKGDREEIAKKIESYIKLRKEKQPLEYPSAGSVFVNSSDKPSSYLIDKAGLKGTRVGDAQVSEKHAGFIINLGKATSKDVLDLIEIIKKEVKDKLDIELEEEVQIIK